MAHNFKDFPELTNGQMAVYYFESPHKQITEDFRGTIVKVHDGDTVTIRTNFRDFDFPIRLADIAAPEMNEGGEDSRDWLKSQILDLEVEVLIDRNNRVGKFGRLIGTIFAIGQNINELSLLNQKSIPFGDRTNELFMNINKELAFQ